MDNKILLAEKALKENGFRVKIFHNIEGVKEALMNSIREDESVGIGGSVTVADLGIYELLKRRGNKVYWHWKGEDRKEELKKAASADIYITSTNALTLDGKLVNMDGTGNRVASMFYGHERVYIIAGKNKICRDYSEAKERIDNVAAPKNAKRLNINTPCRITGKCLDCEAYDRICNVEVIIHKNPSATNINIFLVDEDLGY
ncbi:MAG: LUD domain-containing protein [Tissierellia bacterium]|nr:LUD domain-containing protein [Tissierellia bacterium]